MTTYEDILGKSHRLLREDMMLSETLLASMPKRPPSKTLSVIISAKTHAKLEKLADNQLWSLSQTARVLIEEGLERRGIDISPEELENFLSSTQASE
ncbi:MAG: hypothetical protein F6K58_29005 [Symploca sp. SIO2E9]|nr:hypothetical protein [Symploca sp. SIO2E9]